MTTPQHRDMAGAQLHNSKILTFTGAPASYTPPESGIIVTCLTSPNVGKLYRTTGTTAGAVTLLAAGVDGAAATVSIGDVTATAGASPDVVVANSGTSTAAILDFDFTVVPGADGAGYGGVSTTSLAIASSGSISVTTQAGLAYVVGSRVRLASSATPTNWMEGVVTSYSTTTLVFTADLSNGSGTISIWTLSIAGVRGATGAGTAGADGRTILNGSGAPSGGTGANGDFYIDTTADAIYGPKTAGAWGSPTSLIGPTGSVSSASSLALDPISTPSAPATGILLYTKTGDLRPYYRPASGAETLIGTGSGGRELLTANLTLFVRTDGNDANTGTANTSGGAFLTWQAAIDAVGSRYDLGAFDVTLKQGNTGTFSLSAPIVPRKCVGFGRVILEGDTATPSNCVLSLGIAGAGAVISISQCSTVYEVRGFTLQRSSGTGSCFQSSPNSTIEFQSCRFGATTQYHLFADGGYLKAIGNYSIVGGGVFHSVVQSNGYIECNNASATTVTVTGTPAFAGAFAGAFSYSSQNWINVSFSGSATGSRYLSGATIAVPSGDVNFFPGSSAGSLSGIGVYVSS
jgi:hypothetical protein